MIVTKTNPITGESKSLSIDITGELLHEIRLDTLNNTTEVLEDNKLDYLSLREIKFLYTGVWIPLTGDLEQKLDQHRSINANAKMAR